MSTPRKTRKNYETLPSGPPAPLSNDELTQSVLEKCGVADETLHRVTKKAFIELEQTLEATQAIPVYEHGKIVTYQEQTDHTVRLRAVDMIMKLAGAYPHKTAGSGGARITLNLPGYYTNQAPAAIPAEGKVVNGVI